MHGTKNCITAAECKRESLQRLPEYSGPTFPPSETQTSALLEWLLLSLSRELQSVSRQDTADEQFLPTSIFAVTPRGWNAVALHSSLIFYSSLSCLQPSAGFGRSDGSTGVGG
jgi:hypothetical protein